MNITTIADIGSCHMGKKEYLFELIDRCAAYGVDVVKCQLFDNSYTLGGNIMFHRDWWHEAFEYAKFENIGFAASVFDKAAFDLVKDYAVPFIKFAYSQTSSPALPVCIQMGHKVLATYDFMNVHKAPPGVMKLYTVAINGKPLYPVPFRPDFSNVFPSFDGFSSHCMGIDSEIVAAGAGARYLEFHMTLDHKDITCPDHYFAKRPAEVEALMKQINIMKKLK